MSRLDWRRAKSFSEYEDVREAPACRDRLDFRAARIERAWLNGLKASDAAALSGKSVSEVKTQRQLRRRRARKAASFLPSSA